MHDYSFSRSFSLSLYIYIYIYIYLEISVRKGDRTRERERDLHIYTYIYIYVYLPAYVLYVYIIQRDSCKCIPQYNVLVDLNRNHIHSNTCYICIDHTYLQLYVCMYTWREYTCIDKEWDQVIWALTLYCYIVCY